ncbi:MAG: 2-C-methyl-D-erythritol 4-phosphate cytidylyltransferase [Bacteroidetes bacterium]|jgi:2-C-methyl-D-erythritol 4-phosphate cytidylyltransferase|nr:2-C-methyl-D-erythritol 4-phosphate cytidylyltransferase [Bacteroidota bacterium]
MPARERIAVIVAGGSGQRMNAGLPKQFMLLKGKPVIFYSIEKFHQCGASVIVVLPQSAMQEWKLLTKQYKMDIPHRVAVGGSTRSHSVYSGLKLIGNGNALVAVHDAARPLITAALIEELYLKASETGNAVPVVPVKDSLRKITADENKSVDRGEYFIVQTPQVFGATSLLKAFEKGDFSTFTDEASLMEKYDEKITVIKGESANIKITFPEDIIFAEAVLADQ